jgi:hypothetical protein
MELVDLQSCLCFGTVIPSVRILIVIISKFESRYSPVEWSTESEPVLTLCAEHCVQILEARHRMNDLETTDVGLS